MVNVVRKSVADVDAVVLMVEPIANIGPQEAELLAGIRANGVPAVLAINKIDTVPKESLLAVIAVYREAHAFEAFVPLSARTGDGVEDLLKELEKFATEGPQLFPDGMVTDQPDRQICAELVREKYCFAWTRKFPMASPWK
jgi:GTP-binding protein Era